MNVGIKTQKAFSSLGEGLETRLLLELAELRVYNELIDTCLTALSASTIRDALERVLALPEQRKSMIR